MSFASLFSEFHVGPYVLSHRVVMAPMTRMRATLAGEVTDIMIEHYSSRASNGGLLIMEGIHVSAHGNAFQGSPGIYEDRFIIGLAKVTEAVHAKGGRIFAQLYHAGRASHTLLQSDGSSPRAPSALPFTGSAYTLAGQTMASPARALLPEELPMLVEEFRSAARRANLAGFDGIEVHFANGYLLNQFLEDSSNVRADGYGGSVENRARFPLEVLEAAITQWGPHRVGVRISPEGKFNEMNDSDPDRLFAYLAERLNALDLAYLHIVEPRISGASDEEALAAAKAIACAKLRTLYRGTIIAAGGFDGEDAEAIISRGDADLVAFGRPFIANPDLPERIRSGHPLNTADRTIFYGGDWRGYNDFPTYEQSVSKAE